jgi:hypothetical protein
MPARFNQVQRPTLSDPRRRDYSIFRIVSRSQAKTLFVGLCEGGNFVQAFSLQLTKDVRAPWHWQQVPFGSYDRPIECWPFYPELLEHVKAFTRFEAAAAHQYWWEYYGGYRQCLINCEQPLTRTEFIVQRGKGCWDGYMKGFPNGWVPRL